MCVLTLVYVCVCCLTGVYVLHCVCYVDVCATLWQLACCIDWVICVNIGVYCTGVFVTLGMCYNGVCVCYIEWGMYSMRVCVTLVCALHWYVWY